MIDPKIINWKAVLEAAKLDEEVGVRMAQLIQGDHFSMYVTEISPKQKMNGHYHDKGLEIYTILEGAGILHFAKTTADHELFDKHSKRIIAGDFFSIEAGVVHQLENTSESSLIFILGCPPQHLEEDHISVEDIA